MLGLLICCWQERWWTKSCSRTSPTYHFRSSSWSTTISLAWTTSTCQLSSSGSPATLVCHTVKLIECMWVLWDTYVLWDFEAKDIRLVKPNSESQHLTHNTYVSRNTHTYSIDCTASCVCIYLLSWFTSSRMQHLWREAVSLSSEEKVLFIIPPPLSTLVQL